MKIAPAGDQGLLVTLDEHVTAAELHAARAAVRALPGVIACVPGHSSLLVIGSNADAIRDAIARADRVDITGREHRVRVALDGQDLDEFRARAGSFDIDGLRLTARYLGFRGGFAYLDGWPSEWSMPRRATSRPVRRGSFAIAGNVAAFYPIDTPGGWNVLGTTDHPMNFEAGDSIVIEVVDRVSPLPAPPRETPAIEGIEIVNAPLATVVGPPDWSRTERGLSPGGWFDDRLASLLESPMLECAMVWPKVRTSFAFLGPDGARHEGVGRIEGGLRGYIGRDRGGSVTRGDRNVIRAMAGPHDIGLRELECEVTPQLDRVGIRLKPLQPIEAHVPRDLKSIGMQCGSMQFHPDGSMVIMGPDHPVTGGYLQPATVITSERWKLAQLMPGERVRLLIAE